MYSPFKKKQTQPEEQPKKSGLARRLGRYGAIGVGSLTGSALGGVLGGIGAGLPVAGYAILRGGKLKPKEMAALAGLGIGARTLGGVIGAGYGASKVNQYLDNRAKRKQQQ